MPRSTKTDADSGTTLFGVVFAVVALGVISMAAWRGVDSATSHHVSASASAAAMQAAAVATCRTDYSAVAEAASDYKLLNDRPAPNLSALDQILGSKSVSSPYFMISVTVGSVNVATLGHPAAPGNGNCAYADGNAG